METLQRFRGCLLGLATGDALGACVEFSPRGTFQPVRDMIGGGAFRLQPGQWTDDTSMALCLGMSLIRCRGFDVRDQMRRYLRWMDTGYLSSTGYCFDLGHTVATALERFRATNNPIAGSDDPYTAGNGCIMRLAPVPMFYFPDVDQAELLAAESSRTTHGAEECVDASRLLARIICRALAGRPKEEVLLGDRGRFDGAERIVAIADGAYLEKERDEIRGSGYVVESLEAALWCFARTESFEDAVLAAVALGDDADTTAAVCGQVAGAFYGEAAIPERWREHLAKRDLIEWLAEKLFLMGNAGRAKRPAASTLPRGHPARENQFWCQEIENDEITLEDIPDPDTSIMHDVLLFGLSRDGYPRYGFEVCGRIANRAKDRYMATGELPKMLEELRVCLFFEHRRHHHFGRAPEGEHAVYARNLLRAIREHVKRREERRREAGASL